MAMLLFTCRPQVLSQSSSLVFSRPHPVKMMQWVWLELWLAGPLLLAEGGMGCSSAGVRLRKPLRSTNLTSYSCGESDKQRHTYELYAGNFWHYICYVRSWHSHVTEFHSEKNQVFNSWNIQWYNFYHYFSNILSKRTTIMYISEMRKVYLKTWSSLASSTHFLWMVDQPWISSCLQIQFIVIVQMEIVRWMNVDHMWTDGQKTLREKLYVVYFFQHFNPPSARL